MRKLALAWFLLTAYLVCDGQEVVYKITKNYFRSDPFRGEFSSFMKHLLNDPAIKNKTIEKRTDSTLFYFEGTYSISAYNPFFFKPKRLEVVLTEIAVKLDSLSTDTIFVYELLAYSDDTKEGSQEIKKEFEKIFKHYKNSFARNEYLESPKEKVKGSTYNFFDHSHAVAPFAVSLYGPDEKKEMCLILAVRISAYENMAMPAAPFVLLTGSTEEEQ